MFANNQTSWCNFESKWALALQRTVRHKGAEEGALGKPPKLAPVGKVAAKNTISQAPPIQIPKIPDKNPKNPRHKGAEEESALGKPPKLRPVGKVTAKIMIPQTPTHLCFEIKKSQT